MSSSLNVTEPSNQKQQAASSDNTSPQQREAVGWWNKRCAITDRLDGKLALVTGSNTGIGKCTASELARRGAQVIMACRSVDRAQKAVADIVGRYGEENLSHLTADVADPCMSKVLTPVKKEQFVIEQIDLASLESVRAFAERIKSQYDKIDLLINNAGLIEPVYTKTVDDFEKTLAVNHLGPFLLTELLLPLVKEAAPASRIVMVASLGQRWGQLYRPDMEMAEKEYQYFKAYTSTKLLNVMHARELAKRLEDSGIIVSSLHPGTVKTELARDIDGWFQKAVVSVIGLTAVTPWIGAQTSIYCALSNNIKSGAYYSNCTLTQPQAIALNDSECKWVYDRSCELVKLNVDVSKIE